METSQFKANEFEERLIDFAVRIIKLSACLPKTLAGKHIAGQILRSGTSPAPNYGEARGAESRADFAHKIGIVLKELNETSIWFASFTGADYRSASYSSTLSRRTGSYARFSHLPSRPHAQEKVIDSSILQ
jgi:four helix bundle protein